MNSEKIRELNIIKQNVRRIIYIGVASPSKYEELNQNLDSLFKLENEVKKETTDFLNEIETYKKELSEKIEEENTKHVWIKRVIAAYLIHWLMK